MCALSTTTIIELYVKYGGGKDPYSDAEHKKMEDFVPNLCELWINSVYEADGKLCNEDWITAAAQPEHAWLYNVKQLREKLC